MIVITLTNCPQALRGDLTKWLFEVSTNVFVGRVSARVRDQLWKRIEQYCKEGRATMVFSTNNEQHFDFRVHNSEWEPVNLDGIKLMLRPSAPSTESVKSKRGYSKASHYSMARRKSLISTHNTGEANSPVCDERGLISYTVIDVQTAGLSPEKNTIIKLSALRVLNNNAGDAISLFVRPDVPIAPEIEELTGITNLFLKEHGEPLRVTLEKFLSFLRTDVIVTHNVGFKMRFIAAACSLCGLRAPDNKTEDIMAIAKKKLYNQKSHTVNSIADYLEITSDGQPLNPDSCNMLMKMYEKLQKIN